MTRIEEWIAGKIEECRLGSGGSGGVQELVGALLFLDGKASQVFGMAAQLTAMPEAHILRAQCVSAIRDWYRQLGAWGNVDGQIKLFEFAARHDLRLDLAEPPVLTEIRTLENERARALAEHGEPVDVIPRVANLAADFAEIRRLAPDVPWAAITERSRWHDIGDRLPDVVDVSAFEWCLDGWPSIARAGLEPAFLPIAGADGNYLGFVLDSDLVREQQVPLVYYFHEHDPVYTFVCDSSSAFVHVLQPARPGQPRGELPPATVHPLVQTFLAEMNSFVDAPESSPTRTASVRWLQRRVSEDARATYERSGNAFAARNIAVQQLWTDVEDRIRRRQTR